jgi:hypothetical protein
MPTVVKTIGSSSRNFTTIALWLASLPANLVTDGNIQEGDMFNDSQFTTTAVTTFSGHTTDSTHYIFLTTGAGQSFQDNANVRTNALTYNQTNGVGLSSSTDYNTILSVQDSYTQISKIQIKGSGGHSNAICPSFAAPINLIFRDLIIDMSSVANSGISLAALANSASNASTTGFIINCAVFLRTTGANAISAQGSVSVIGCTVVRSTAVAASGIGYTSQYGSNILQSCASFGFTTAADAVAWSAGSSKNNGTDQASGLPGSSNQVSITYSATSPFTQAGTSGTDLRTATGTNLSSNGFKDSTNAPNDISGTARASSPTIGAWELSASAAAAVPPSLLPLMGVG